MPTPISGTREFWPRRADASPTSIPGSPSRSFRDAGARTACRGSGASFCRRPQGAPGVARAFTPGPAGFSWLLDAARRQDLIVVGGGGLLQDDDSRIKVPYWASRLLALRVFQRNIFGLSLGVGPLEHAESRASARMICELLSSISVRDEFAHDWLQRCSGATGALVAYPT